MARFLTIGNLLVEDIVLLDGREAEGFDAGARVFAQTVASSGWEPLPMYALDQCVHSDRVIPGRYRLMSSIHSDHRLQVFDFSLR